LIGMSELKEEAIDQIIDKAKAVIPSPIGVFKEATSRIPESQLQPDYVRTHFSEMIVELERLAYSIYLDYEKKAIEPVIQLWYDENRQTIARLRSELDEASYAKSIASLFWPIAKRMEFRLGQMRKARAGRTFEFIVETLLKEAGGKCERPKGQRARKILKRIDLVLPNQKPPFSGLTKHTSSLARERFAKDGSRPSQKESRAGEYSY